MTAIDAYQRDYEVLIASDCVASYDAEHHEVTKRYLDAGIARLMSSRRNRQNNGDVGRRIRRCTWSGHLKAGVKNERALKDTPRSDYCRSQLQSLNLDRRNHVCNHCGLRSMIGRTLSTCGGAAVGPDICFT